MATSATSPARRSRWWWAAGLVLLLLVVGVLRRPSGVRGRLEAIRARGDPVYLEDLAVAQGAQAAVARRHAEELSRLAVRIPVEFEQTPPRQGTNSRQEYLWARRQLSESNAERFDVLHAFLDRGPWSYADFSRGILGVSQGPLSTVKGLALVLQVEAVSSAIVGNSGRATAAVLAGLRLSATLGAEPLLFHHLIAMALDSITVASAETVCSRVQLTDPELVALQDAFRAAEGTNALVRVLTMERAYFMSSTLASPGQMFFLLTVGTGFGNQVPDVFRPVLGTLYHALLRSGDQAHFLDQTQRLMDLATRSVPEARAALRQFDADLQKSRGPWNHPLSRRSLSSISGAFEREWRHVATLRCARAGCAVERYRGRHGKLPGRLEELVPDFLDRVPSDPMTGEPLKYRLLPRGYVLYSIGEDDTDDGGVEFARRPMSRQGGWDYTFTVER